MGSRKKTKNVTKDANKEQLKRKPKTILKRKQLRQEKKKAKKKSKKDFFQKKFNQNTVSDEFDEEIPSSEDEESSPVVKAKIDSPTVKQMAEVNKKTNKELKELNRQQKKQRNKQLKLANVQEEKNIKQLEKQLGLKKRKSKNLPKSFLDDGLDYILDACDSTKLENMMDASDEEGDDDKMILPDNNLADSEDESDQDNSDDDDTFPSVDVGDGISEDDNEDEVSLSDVAQDGEEFEEKLDTDEEIMNHDHNSDIESQEMEWEDIYGRKRDHKGNIIQSVASENLVTNKYVPPALRNKGVTGSENEEKKKALARLSKQLKGLLNRLAETNMHGIAKEVEGFYRQFSRNDVNNTLTELYMSSLVTQVTTPVRLVMEHVMLVAILHANVGTEVGAHFLQTVVQKFNSYYNEADSTESEDKTLDNMILLISYMYSFKIVGAKLIFDVLTKLSNSFKPKDIELIVITLRNCGFVLRKDDPTSLKNLILQIQSEASKSQEEDARIQFMLEVLMAIKNNNVNKIPNYDPSHFENLKKGLKNHLREGNFVTEMKIGYRDLVEAENRGRWWIVGSAFTGHLAGSTEVETEESSKSKSLVTDQYSDKLLDLARKMRMNTDNRRNIFCIIMTAEDFIDCSEKLAKLGTKNQMEREVIFVLADCCVQETQFNPYYAHVAKRMAAIDRKYRLATQFHIWDRLKQVQNLKKIQLNNLAQFTLFLIKEKAQSLGILKVIEFAEMNKVNVRFLRKVLNGILLDQEEESVKICFAAISEQSNLNIFRESLRLFMHHFLLKQNDVNVDLNEIKNRVKIAEKALMSSSSKLRL